MYVDYNTAKRLKELKFRKPTKFIYDSKKQLMERIGFYADSVLMNDEFLAPTHSEVKKWLREEKGIEVEPSLNTFDKDEEKYFIGVMIENKGWLGIGTLKSFKTYEQSEAAGIKEALNYLNK